MNKERGEEYSLTKKIDFIPKATLRVAHDRVCGSPRARTPRTRIRSCTIPQHQRESFFFTHARPVRAAPDTTDVMMAAALHATSHHRSDTHVRPVHRRDVRLATDDTPASFVHTRVTAKSWPHEAIPPTAMAMDVPMQTASYHTGSIFARPTAPTCRRCTRESVNAECAPAPVVVRDT